MNQGKIVLKFSLLKSIHGRKSGFFSAHITSLLPSPQEKEYCESYENISSELGQFSETYSNLILIGDVNVETKEDNMPDFLNIYSLKNLVKQKGMF